MAERTTVLSVGDHRLHAVRWEAEGSDTGHAPVLLVPGLGGSHVDWMPAGRLLADRLGGPVTVIDLPGFGHSRLKSRRANLEHFVDVVATVLDDMGPATLVGNSMGALVGLFVAEAHPERVGRLVLADPALPAQPVTVRSVLASLPFLIGTAPVIGHRTLRLRKRLLGPEGYVTQRLRGNVHRVDRVPDDVRQAMVELTTQRLGYREAERAYSASARSILRRWSDGYRAAEAVSVPTLVVHGREDAVVPVAVADRLRGLREDWRFELFEDCGHLPHLEHPERFSDVVASWAGQSARSHDSFADE